MAKRKNKNRDDPSLSAFPNGIIDEIREPLLLLGSDGRIMNINKGTMATFGYGKDEMRDQDVKALVSKEDHEDLSKALKQGVKGGHPDPIEVLGVTKAKKEIQLEVEVGPIKVGNKVSGLWLRARDITDRKRLEFDLEETRNLLDNIISSAEEGFITLNRDGIVVIWGQGAERIFAIRSKEMLGRPFTNTFEDDIQVRRFHKIMKDLSSGRSKHSMEMVLTRNGGHETYLNISVSPIRDRDRKIKDIMITIKDATEKKHLEVRLKESEKRLATEVIKKIEDLKYIEQLNRFIVQYMEEGAILLDTRLKIGFVNPQILDLLGYEEKELIDHSIKKIIPKDLLWVWSEITERSQRESFRFESPIVNKDGDEIPVMVTASSIKIETRRSEFLCTIIDLTEQKEKETKLKEEMLKFRIKRGTANVILEKGYNKAADVLTTLRNFGHNIIVLSRRSNRDMLKPLADEKEDRIIWLEKKGQGLRSLEPTMEALTSFFENKVDRATVVVLDRIDYLISKMGFGAVVGLLHDLVEMFYHRKAILLLLIDPSTVTEQQLGQLEKDAPIIEAKMGLVLPGDLQEILMYVSQQNRMDNEPSYKDIGKRFKITKTTTRKRIQQLQILELVAETKRGRTKVLKISDKGYRYVLAQSSRIG